MTAARVLNSAGTDAQFERLRCAISRGILICARLRHVAGTQWGSKKYMNMKHLDAMEQETLVG